MTDSIPTGGVHHFRLTVSDVDRSVAFYTGVLGFRKLMDLNPGAFLSNGAIGLGIGPFPDPKRALKNDRFDENRIGLDHMSFAVPSRQTLEEAVGVLDRHGIAQRGQGSRRGVRDRHPHLPRSGQRPARAQRPAMTTRSRAGYS